MKGGEQWLFGVTSPEMRMELEVGDGGTKMQGVQTHIHEVEAGNEHGHCKIIQFCDCRTDQDKWMTSL